MEVSSKYLLITISFIIFIRWTSTGNFIYFPCYFFFFYEGGWGCCLETKSLICPMQYCRSVDIIHAWPQKKMFAKVFLILHWNMLITMAILSTYYLYFFSPHSSAFIHLQTLFTNSEPITSLGCFFIVWAIPVLTVQAFIFIGCNPLLYFKINRNNTAMHLTSGTMNTG